MVKLINGIKYINLAPILFAGYLCLIGTFYTSAQNPNVIVSIHLRGVSGNTISLLPLTGEKQLKSIADVQGVNKGIPVSLEVSKKYLPGEFILSFENKEHPESKPVHTEKRILINDQNIELWINPVYANNPDSTWFQKAEKENTAYASFSKEKSSRLEKMAVFQRFLMKKDDINSVLYKQKAEEFEQERQAFNHWLKSSTHQDRSKFASRLYLFNYLPPIPWGGSEKDIEVSVLQHYFDGIDFNDPVIIKTAQMNDWMDNYVNLHMKMITKMSMRDSIISKAATTAIEKSKQGSPLVYGWMVDYFYKGFEANNIPAGMKALESYLADPNCLTSKRMEIERRLKGMESLVPGTKAPNILMPDAKGNVFNLDSFNPTTQYILVLFWSADCSHCLETLGSLYPWQQTTENQQKVSVIAVSVDETETEIKAWDQKINELSGWEHIRTPEGIRSKVASDYFVLATPVMILIDTQTKEIVSLPASINELESSLK